MHPSQQYKPNSITKLNQQETATTPLQAETYSFKYHKSQVCHLTVRFQTVLCVFLPLQAAVGFHSFLYHITINLQRLNAARCKHRLM